jgi:hypothetical protein
VAGLIFKKRLIFLESSVIIIFMEEIIYNSKELAKSACIQYVEAMRDLRTKFGVREENDDSCTETYIYAKYRNEKGEIADYCYN